MKKFTRDVIDKINAIYKKAGEPTLIDPNYNLNDPFMLFADSADPYGFKSCSWEKMYDAFEDEINDAFNINSLDEFKKISPYKIVEKMDEYMGSTPERFTDFQDVNDLDSTFKEILANEFSNPEYYLDPVTDRETAIQIHNEVAKLLGLEEYLLNEDDLTEDSKMKKDVDPRLELVKKIWDYIKEYDDSDYTSDWNSNDRICGWFDYIFKSLKDEDIAELLDKPLEEIKKTPTKQLLKELKEIENDFYNTTYDANDLEGITRIYNCYFKDKNLTNDSVQKQICDSFNKRYKGDK